MVYLAGEYQYDTRLQARIHHMKGTESSNRKITESIPHKKAFSTPNGSIKRLENKICEVKQEV